MDRRVSVAPMMDWTDRHCRYFHRLLSPHARLYTEMVTSAALVRGKQLRLLEHSQQEHPVALQLGGSEPQELAIAARYGMDAGYDEINLNVGCPSDRVQSLPPLIWPESGAVVSCQVSKQKGTGMASPIQQRLLDLATDIAARGPGGHP